MERFCTNTAALCLFGNGFPATYCWKLMAQPVCKEVHCNGKLFLFSRDIIVQFCCPSGYKLLNLRDSL